MIPYLYLGKKCRIIPIDGSEPFDDYIEGHFYESHFVTSNGIEITPNGVEAIPTRNHIPIRKPRFFIEWYD